jgi:hypothetical protein
MLIHHRLRPGHHYRPGHGRCLSGAWATVLLCGLWAGQARALELPCPVPAGWDLVQKASLPRQGADGRRIGGFSAASFGAASDELWLLSDLPQGSLSLWTGLTATLQGKGSPQLLRSLPLEREPMDGEGLVRLNGQLWVASEGRRTELRPAELLRFDAATGRLLQRVDLPADWQTAPNRGLASNAGPESLALWRQADGRPALLMAAERPLLQDPPRHVRVLRWQWPTGADRSRMAPSPSPQGALLLPYGDDWGLTELLVVQPSGRLLALLRRFQFPNQWQIRLALYPMPEPGQARPAAPLAQWDLLAAGLEPDNWEGITAGPPLNDGRPVLVLVSDDNLNPLQDNRLALLAPRCP